jgi:hypothetical protein
MIRTEQKAGQENWADWLVLGCGNMATRQGGVGCAGEEKKEKEGRGEWAGFGFGPRSDLGFENSFHFPSLIQNQNEFERFLLKYKTKALK